MTDTDYTKLDYFQCYIDSPGYQDKVIKDGETGNHVIMNTYIPFVQQYLKEWFDYLEETFVQCVTAIEIGSEGHRIHFQTLIRHKFKNRQTATSKVKAFAVSKRLDAKKNEFGCIKGTMNGSFEHNIAYILKDQVKEGRGSNWFASSTIDPMHLQCGVWIPKDEFKFDYDKKVNPNVCWKCKGSMNYSQRICNDYVKNQATYGDPTMYNITKYVTETVLHDKARLPNHMIIELVRAICYHLEILNRDDYIQSIISKIT